MKRLGLVLLLCGLANAADEVPVKIVELKGYQQSPVYATLLREKCPAVTTDAPVAKYLVGWYESSDFSGTEFFLRDARTFDDLGSGHAKHLADAAKKLCKLIEKASKGESVAASH